MYDNHDSINSSFHEGQAGFEHDFPEVPEHWTLGDFEDIVAVGGGTS